MGQIHHILRIGGWKEAAAREGHEGRMEVRKKVRNRESLLAFFQDPLSRDLFLCGIGGEFK